MKVFLMLADGFEETEALVPWDVLRRAGADIKLVSVSNTKAVSGAHGLSLTADTTIENVGSELPDCFVLPGGMPGMTNLLACGPLCDMLIRASSCGKVLAAICASPSVLGELGILNGRNAVCFPGFESRLKGARISEDSVCRDGNVLTGKGMGVAFEFAFALTEMLFGKSVSEKLKKEVQYK